MAGKTKISWATDVWNPIRGCTRVSPGCGGPGPHGGCYAEGIAARFSGPGLAFEGFADRSRSGSKWTGRVELLPHALLQPLLWRTPRLIFVNSMSDLFHEKLSDEEIDAVFGIMALAHWHTFQVLTKRADRMQKWAEAHSKRRASEGECVAEAYHHCPNLAASLPFDIDQAKGVRQRGWPLPNVWMGVSVENQDAADERIPALRATPAAIRFVSFEPLLGPVTAHLAGIDWAIMGGESGPRSRPTQPVWVTSLIRQCRDYGTAPYFKQTGMNLGPWPIGITGKGDNPALWPPEVNVQEYPA